MKERFADTYRLVYVLAAVLVTTAMLAQESSSPMVTSIGVPAYPPIARTANVEGTVEVKVTTDGNRVVAVHAENGHKVLAAAAEENARTWQFMTHRPTTFKVTYRYKLVTDLPEQSHPKVVLQLPHHVEVDILRWPGTHDESPELHPNKSQGDTNSIHENGHAAEVGKSATRR